MKIAVSYSGMFRDFVDNIDNHKECILSKYDCDVYFHFWDVYGTYIYFDRSNEVPKPGVTPPTFYTNYISEQDKQKAISELNPVAWEFESYKLMEPTFKEMVSRANKTNEGPPNILNLASMKYKVYKGIEMIKATGRHYDVIIKIRTDLRFTPAFNLESIEPNTIYGIKEEPIYNWSWNEDTVSDIVFYGDPVSMDVAHDLYINLEDMWKKYGPNTAPEYLFPLFLKDNGCNITKSEKINLIKLTGR